MLGAILTQNTSWNGADKALVGLRSLTVLDPMSISVLSDEQLEGAIRPSGYFRQKAGRIRTLCLYHLENYEGDVERMQLAPTDRLREELLSIKGIGPETADSILLYALDRPVFVVDAYTVRLFSRLGLCAESPRYDDVQSLFMDNLESDAEVFNEYHALIVKHCKQRCRKQLPVCTDCPLIGVCGWEFKIQNSKFKRKQK
jgi:endonuclease-3 related protein